MDLESSIGVNNNKEEESVDDLIKKLNARGTRVKILKEDDPAQTPIANQGKKVSQSDVANTKKEP